jgi:transposase InsO family protein
MARGGNKFLIVAIDTFTKWVEVEPIGRITKENIVKFLHGIVMRFDVPNQLISDNGTQFISKKFENFCVTYRIKHPQSSVNHPMTNENVERANGIIQEGIKTLIFDRVKAYDKKWAQEVPIVLWSMRTTSSHATSETPFFLVYGAKAVLPPDIRLKSP